MTQIRLSPTATQEAWSALQAIAQTSSVQIQRVIAIGRPENRNNPTPVGEVGLVVALGACADDPADTSGLPSACSFKGRWRDDPREALKGLPLVEETFDWFAQDMDGNVWYFGEDATEFQNGVPVSHEGSWEAGVDGAMPGIVMEANPRVGDSYKQECAAGVAEDEAKVQSVNKSLCVRYGCFDDVVQTRETSPLDPHVVELKYYAPDVGFIQGDMVKGGSEHTELVSISKK